jgi:carboxyl-terminal processing protease
MNDKGADVAEKDANVHTPKQVRTVRLSTTIVIGIVVAIVAYVGGMRSDQFMIQFGNSQNKNAPAQLDFSSVQSVYDKLRGDFDGQIDAQKLIDGAKKGMVEAAGDPYTEYFTDSEAKQFLGDLEGKFSGIGAELDKRNNQLIISSTIDNSPAKKAGLQPGDAIMKVNDEDTTGWSIEQGVAKIRGDKGTTVKLSIVRDNQPQDISIVRDDIVTPSVTHSIDSNNIGYLRITRFAEGDTSTLAKQAAQEFKDKNVKGIVLDVRGNGGGYLTAAQDIASLWLKDGTTIVQERRGSAVQETLKANGDAILNGIPTTVLVDGGSASASEIVAGALHDNNAAKLVGEKTFGKGSVQQIENMSGGGELKVTVAKWYTPNGKNINKEGIQPDEKVSISDDDLKNNRDPQKDKAIELVKGQ